MVNYIDDNFPFVDGYIPDDIVDTIYYPQPDIATTVEFTSFLSTGWVGYCNN